MEYVEAEYDHENNVVVALRSSDGREVLTHNARVLGAPTEWLPTQTVYPAGYDSRFNGLLHSDQLMFAHDEDRGVIRVEFPQADFSPGAIRQELIRKSNMMANKILQETDFYVIRQVDTGKPMPTEIAQTRSAVRAKSDDYARQIAAASEEELLHIKVTYGTEPGQPTPSPKPVRGADGRLWVTDATHPDQQGNPIEPVEGE